jgi:3'-phosphoadenosine 5'-phosphosulfate sulfotransferase (PAPS reductase)/FAD synthetase
MTVATFAAKPRIDPQRVAEARQIIKDGLRLGRALVAYSGGKDGLCAALLARDLGVTLGVCELSFTFVDQERDIRQTANHLGGQVVWRNTLDIAWLAAHPQFVFNRDTRAINTFCQVRQRDSVEHYARDHGYRVVITGRKKHGNSVRYAIHPRANGTVGCHPLRDWDDGDIWAYLRDAGIPVPWVYRTSFGRHEGNSAWPFCRQYADKFNNYAVIYSIEPPIVLQAAAAGVIGAREFLARGPVDAKSTAILGHADRDRGDSGAQGAAEQRSRPSRAADCRVYARDTEIRPDPARRHR